VLVVAAMGGPGDASAAPWINVGPAGGGVSGVAVDPDDARHAIVLDSAGIAHAPRPTPIERQPF